VPLGAGLAGGVRGRGGGARGGRRADAGQGPRGRPGPVLDAVRSHPTRGDTGGGRLHGPLWLVPPRVRRRWVGGGRGRGGGGAGGRDGDSAVGDGGGHVGGVPWRWPPRHNRAFPMEARLLVTAGAFSASVWGRWGIARGRRGHGRARRPHCILN
jgi:hypothetical protein